MIASYRISWKSDNILTDHDLKINYYAQNINAYGFY